MPAAVATEERFRKLEARVEHLEVFSAPGQMAALSANVAEVRTIVTDLKRQADRLGQKMGAVETRPDGIDGRLDQLDGRFHCVDGRLNGIDGRLNRVEGGLERLGGGLKAVNQRLDQQGHLLGEILGRLPKPTGPANN
jgi:uncharacterized coiled-coil protein SlyX